MEGLEETKIESVMDFKMAFVFAVAEIGYFIVS